MTAQWDFECFNYFFESKLNAAEREVFFTHTLPGIIELALQLPTLCPAPIPLLRQGWSAAVTLSQLQIASLLAHSFLCTFPARRSSRARKTLPRVNFEQLYCDWDDRAEQKLQKLRCFVAYFEAVVRDPPVGTVTVIRHCQQSFPEWAGETSTFPPLTVSVDGKIEDLPGHSHVDFANKYLGGGVLGRGAVQEEILFAICPELVVSCLLCEVLRSAEAVVIKGAVRYSNYQGYASDFKWAGPHAPSLAPSEPDGESETAAAAATADAAAADAPRADSAPPQPSSAERPSGPAQPPTPPKPLPRDSLRRAETQVLAIDALKIDKWDAQYRERSVLRELNKAFAGFGSPHGPHPDLGIAPLPIATGNWGCGAFGGEKHLKAVLQLMACAVAGRPCVYCTFGDGPLAAKLELMHRLILECDVCVAEIWGFVMQYCRAYIRDDVEDDLCKFIIEKCNSM